ncbi:MAG: hydrogenase maturation protease [Thiobacillus sp.]|jgi:hydrogenase maturation protease|uniref:hydrogenase maturation protease n=1 Tax=Thiobacillus sp. TaxID=924 RepID=UPI002893A76A|nr:hydrogenase maturation protease [Thiobacillus sp.]MDT3706464.1 hydrogenase maturation protease [Thiobacillus sp.]
MKAVHILGIGSPSGDDRAGWLAVDALLASDVRARHDGIVIEKLDRPGASLIPRLENASWVILVDAMQGGGQPGRIRHFNQQDWHGYGHGLSSHGIGVLDALSLAHALGFLPPRLDLYGIEVGSVGPGETAGYEVLAAAQWLAAWIADSLEEAAA